MKAKGFTLIEVLLALAVIAISLTALLKASAENIHNTERLKNKIISHWVAMQGLAAMQLKLVDFKTQKEITEVTELLGERWYWRVKRDASPFQHVEQITIRVSKHQAGPFIDPLIGYRYNP